MLPGAIGFAAAVVLVGERETCMADSAITRPSLLLRIRDSGDRQAWSEFVGLYAPLVYGFARKHGLQSADAADLTQEVLRAVAGAAERFRYDPQRGTFRGWLFTVVRNRLRNFLAGVRRHPQASGGPEAQRQLEEVPAPEEEEALWEREYERRLFDWAAEQVRQDCQEKTWQAFWRTAVEGQSGQEAAAALGMSPAAVYLAKRRVMDRLREYLQQVKED
jgi:RNA polymerase sigma-70 factor (ECF subfamily)